VQLGETVPPELIFNDTYPYYSSTSDSLVEASRQHIESLVIERKLGAAHTAVELASNDGYLLQWFLKSGLRVLGIDPSPGPALVAQKKGIPTKIDFFTTAVARELRAEGVAADVVVANNVLAHVGDLNDFVEGIAVLLTADGVAQVEFPYVRDLVERGAFDTIYHEHRCYFSVHAVRTLFERHGLTLQRVVPLPQQGGSLRCTFGRERTTDSSVVEYLRQEFKSAVTSLDYFAEFAHKVEEIAEKLRRLLTALKSSGARIVGYGAAAKGATLLNYVGIGCSHLDYVVDRNSRKQGWLMPGVELPIVSPDRLLQDQPEYVLLLAWNLVDEIVDQQSDYLRRGGRLIVPVPVPEILTVGR
jgi:SAM-dependent methyltransferase